MQQAIDSCKPLCYRNRGLRSISGRVREIFGMRVHVRLFAAAREIVGQGDVSLELADGSTVGDLMEDFFTRYPDLRRIAGSLLLAVNRELAERTVPLHEGDEVGVIPPVSGGGGV